MGSVRVPHPVLGVSVVLPFLMDVDLDSKTSILNIAGFHFFIDKKTKSLPDFTPEIKQALSDNSLKHHMC
jgi:hypothetical protein